MKPSTLLAVVVCILWMKLGSAQWRGYYTTVRRSYTQWESYCTCWYWWWGCSHYRGYWKTYYYYTQQCQIGWTHSGDKNCNIPVCKPACINGGTCVNPNECECPSTSRGRYTGCSELTCSYKRPCYPGDCHQGTNCTCEPGFLLNKTDDGCIIFDPSHEELKPVVGRSNVTLSDIRRTDNRIGYMFVLEGTNLTEGSMSIVWSNQKRFNNLRFEYESYFEQPENLPDRPNYVSQAKLGIVNSFIEVNVSKVSRNKYALMRDEGSFKRYKCDAGFSPDNPAVELASCVVNDDQFKTLIEHGDWLNVKFKTDSGGFQKLINLDQQGELYGTKYYKGLLDVKEVQFNFDFIAPKHCSEKDSFRSCSGDAVMLKVEQEFTKKAIKLYWLGWEDDLSKTLLAYYVEIFKLSPDPYGRLTEMAPLAPVFNRHVDYTNSSIDYPEYQPSEPGMYSVLMETKDLANNSRITRRFVLYDDQSEIALNNDQNSSLYVSSAVEETGYKWIRPSSGREVTINVIWKNHFVNKFHEENKLLNEIQEYPIQFKEIQDDGVLFSQKFVADALDDHEGERTRDSLHNYHGIVKFEIGKEFTLSDAEPSSWEIVSPFKETSSFSAKLDDGYRVRVWIRATDVMGNTKTDSTLIRVDGTPPTISLRGSDGHEIFKNIENGEYNYTSRLTFAAADQQSGVHKLEYTITLSVPEKDDKVVYTGVSPAMISNDTSNPFCQIVEGKCFIPKQQLDLDNCWFMPMKSELDSGTAVVNVTVYNQALLSASTLFQVGKVNTLKGLEKYDGPFNIRIESPSPNGFRVAWDLPEKTSCYGRAEIVIVLLRKGSDGSVEPETYYTSGTKKYFDILGLNPSTDYEIKFAMKAFNSTALQDATSLSAKTAEPLEAGAGAGAIAGAVIAVLIIVVIAVVVVIVLIRKGIIQPPQQVQQVSRAVSKRVRMTVRRRTDTDTETGAKPKKKLLKYDNRQSELYIYGEMDVRSPQVWHIDRKDVTLDTLIKSGNFASIYKARVKGYKGGDVVAAKTLKEGFTQDDEMAMKAKINFTGSKVGEHPNVIKFIGAVVNDDAMGPFIIYEYCEHGPLKDYLVDHKNNITLELTENLFRFGLDIAKGMEYLASKQIVHRRLAARNILLTFINEVKIAGFGPQPDEEDGGDSEKGKRERIPIKWMAPECMSSTRDATEKSDVWSYAVVLWEIFSLGDAPYSGKGRDLPSKLKKGERLSKPEQCDDAWYAVMKKCWAYEPKKRPTFADLRGELDSMFVAAPGDDYYYKR